MDCIAHRGYAGEYPENTRYAVSEAAATADWIEVDARRCGSGEVVAVHDATVDRVTDASGAVADFTAAELAALDVLGSGEGVPTLETVLDAIPPSVGVDVELKERGLAGEVTDLLEARDGPALVSSFDAHVIREASASGEHPTALIGAAEPYRLIEDATHFGCSTLPLEIGAVDGAVVERAHEAGLAVYAWTVRDRDALDHCVEAGVDGTIVDESRFCE